VNLTRLDALNSPLLFPSSSNASQSASPDAPIVIPVPDSLPGDLNPVGIFVLIAILAVIVSVVTFHGWRRHVPIVSLCGCFPCIVFYPGDNGRESGTPSFVNMDVLRNPAGVTTRPVSNQDDGNVNDAFGSADASSHDRMRLSKASDDHQSFPFPMRFGRDGEPEIQHYPM
jgi:hypothetical protein